MSKDREFMMNKIALGMQIFKMVCEELGDKSVYKDKLLIPTYRFVVDHCKKSVAELLEEGHNTSLADTYQSICDDMSTIPQGRELMENVITYGHYKMMVRYMVYCHREMADSESAKKFEQNLKEVEEYERNG